ncbi:MAG: type 1 glutamine amidotransferase [Anaerolineales bacterium]|nr:type 1 glutamine amidotransferase [Anaerolineales bacterium]MCZ2123081.1 type 1 glutamine amidotransferase [Anaerolineales bacterium]
MRLQNKIIATLIAEGVEDLEYYVPLMRLQEEGAKVLSAGLDLKPVKGKNGLIITPDAKIEDLKASELFALIIPGGFAPDKLRRYDVVKKFVKDVNNANKIIGIICHGGSTAISAGIIKKGQRVTGSAGIKDDLVNAGGVWVDESAFREGNQVWGRVVADIPDFNRELVKALIES